VYAGTIFGIWERREKKGGKGGGNEHLLDILPALIWGESGLHFSFIISRKKKGGGGNLYLHSYPGVYSSEPRLSTLSHPGEGGWGRTLESEDKKEGPPPYCSQPITGDSGRGRGGETIGREVGVIPRGSKGHSFFWRRGNGKEKEDQVFSLAGKTVSQQLGEKGRCVRGPSVKGGKP